MFKLPRVFAALGFMTSLFLSSLPLAAEPFSAVKLSDPTRPLQETVSTQRELPALKLNSVLISKQRRLAVINGQTVAEGEQVSGAKVLRISSDRVQLQRAGQSVEIRLHSSQIRSNAG